MMQMNLSELRRQQQEALERRVRLAGGPWKPEAVLPEPEPDPVPEQEDEAPTSPEPITVKISARGKADAHIKTYELYSELSKIVPKRVTVAEIIQTVSDVYRVSKLEIISPRREARLIRPRHVAMYLAKHLTALSLPQIGRRFGGKDHSTIHHAVKRISRLIEEGDDVADEIKALIAIFGGAA